MLHAVEVVPTPRRIGAPAVAGKAKRGNRANASSNFALMCDASHVGGRVVDYGPAATASISRVGVQYVMTVTANDDMFARWDLDPRA